VTAKRSLSASRDRLMGMDRADLNFRLATMMLPQQETRRETVTGPGGPAG